MSDPNDERTADKTAGDSDLSYKEWGKKGGAPEGNKNAVGNSGGAGGQPNNQNAASHHLRSDPEKLLPWLEEHKPDQAQWVMQKYRSYLDRVSFEHGSGLADKLLEAVVCEYIIWMNRGVQLKDGIVTKTHMKDSEGNVYETEGERPENQALNRMDRQVMSKLKDLGVFDEDEGIVGPETTMRSEDYTITVESKKVESDEDEQAEGGSEDVSDHEPDDGPEEDHEDNPPE